MVKKHEWNLSTPRFTEEELKDDERPKLLFAGIFSPVYDSNYMVRGFEEAGYNVTPFDWQKIRFAEKAQGVNDRLLFKVAQENPAVVFLHVQSPDVLDVAVLESISKKSFIVFYTFDVRNDIKWIKELAPYVGLILFADKESVNECKKDGIENVDYLPPAADYLQYRRLEIREATDEFGEIVFIGNNTTGSALNFPKAEERAEMVNFLQNQFGSRFKVYGLNWGMNSQMVYPHIETMVYNSAKIAITHNHYSRAGYQSDRMYRAMGSGIYTIAQYYHGINQDFNPTTNSTWIDFDMLAEEIEKALSNDERRKMIADNGHGFVRQHHTWAKRAERMKNLISQYEKILGR